MLDVAVVDPLLAHEDRVDGSGAVDDDAFVVEADLLRRHACRASALLEKHIFVLTALAVKLRQAGNGNRPGGVFLRRHMDVLLLLAVLER